MASSGEELLLALSNANLHLRDLLLLPSCSAEVLETAELVSLELVKALSLLARAKAPQRPAPPRPEPAPAVAGPFYLSSLSSSSPPPPLPPPAPDTPAVAPKLVPLDVALRAATGQLPAAADDFLPPYLVNKMRQQQNGKQPQLAPQEFPSLGGCGSTPSAGAAGAWGRGRPPTLVAPQQARPAASSGPPAAAPPPPPRGFVQREPTSPAYSPSGDAPRRLGDGFAGAVSAALDEAEKERLKQVVRCASFSAFETVKGRQVNIMAGLELHKNVLNAKEQGRLLEFIWEQLARGRGDQLPGRTFSAPRKWMKGKGRITIQYGVCYSYANPPGITDDVTEAMPKTLNAVIDRMVRWGVLPASVRPDSCIINIYEEADCIPPHIDHHDFTRPFCTMSLLSEAPIVFGARLDIVGEGEFAGSFMLPLPVGSVCVIKGNAADVAKHAVPSVPQKRVSITFRKVSDGKRSLARTVPFGGHERNVLE